MNNQSNYQPKEAAQQRFRRLVGSLDGLGASKGQKSPTVLAQTARPASPVVPGQAQRAVHPPPAGAKPVAGLPGTRRPAPRAQAARPLPSVLNLGCLLRLVLVSVIFLAIIVLGGLSFGFYQYYQIAAQLPDISDIRQKAAQFETTRIFDRNGNVLYEILDPNAGRRTYVPLEKISPYLVAATIATEDKAFYSHPGFDLTAIARAFLQNYQSNEIASGASTITQQLARALLFSPEERVEQSYRRKLREAILAAEITRRYTKDEILELYLNESFYGNLSYGVQAAAETYFDTTADNLTLGQATFLAGLPQAPAVYDIYTNPQATLRRQEDVLVLMYQNSQEAGCIYVSNAPQRVCLDPVMVTEAANEIKNVKFEKRPVQMRFPHWVTYIRALLESEYDPQTIYRSGFQVYTTLDPAIQDMAQQIVKDQVANLADKNATDGALIAIKPSTGEILAMVGSADFYNEAISGQVNMAINPRQPGSAIKPLTYLAAFEKGWTPSTLIWDVATEFSPSGVPDDPSPPYAPVNYDGRFHGPVLSRSALGNSYNIPAVKALNFIGIYDNPVSPELDGFIETARRLGINSLNRPDYGLSLTLGGGEVTLLELTSAYATLANSGRRQTPAAITRITDYKGNVIFEREPQPGDQVMRPEHAFLLSSILSDNEARTAMFGANSVLNLPFQAAAKTGTTNDFRDNWTLGYTPDLAAGVWIGNADYSPMQNTTGLSGAAPIWAEFMTRVIPQVSLNNPTPFIRPGGIVDQVICAISGTLPSQWCPEQRVEMFTSDQLPLPAEKDLWQEPTLDTWTGLLASPACEGFTEKKLVLNVNDPTAKKWIKKDPQGQEWAERMGFEAPVAFAPERECQAEDPRPKLAIISPLENQIIQNSPLELYAVADATAWFDYYRLEYGFGDDPQEWIVLDERHSPVPQPAVIYSWDLRDLPPGRVTVRLWMHSTEDTYAETKLHLDLQAPTPTPLPTETPIPTPTPMPSLTPTPTLFPTLPVVPTSPIFPKATDTPPP